MGPCDPRTEPVEAHGRLSCLRCHSFFDNDQDGNGVFDGACEVCHLEEVLDHPSHPDPLVGRTCTVCHRHADGFEPVVEGTCEACH